MSPTAYTSSLSFQELLEKEMELQRRRNVHVALKQHSLAVSQNSSVDLFRDAASWYA